MKFLILLLLVSCASSHQEEQADFADQDLNTLLEDFEEDNQMPARVKKFKQAKKQTKRIIK